MFQTELRKLLVGLLVTVGFAVLLATAMTGAVSAQENGGCLYVWSADEEGNDVRSSIYVSAPNGEYSNLHDTDDDPSNSCSPVADSNGVSFETPGGEDYLVYVYRDSDELWGMFETNVPADEEEFMNVERGGIYPVGSNVESSSDIYPAGGEAEVTVDLENGQGSISADGTVNIYIYPVGESRPSTPTEVIQADSVSKSTGEEVSSTVPLPDEAGEHVVDIRVDTTYYHSSFSDFTHFSGDIDGGTIDIIDPQPPEITQSAPEDPQVRINEGESQTFSVSASDPNVPDSQIETSWYVNGNEAGTGESFTFAADEYGNGDHRIRVEVDDGLSATDSRTDEWAISVIAGPEIEAMDVDPQRVQAGESITLRADAYSPDGEAKNFQYTWTLGGETYEGASVTATPRSVGDQQVQLVVENENGVAETRTETITVENVEPTIEVQNSISGEVTAGESLSVSANVRNPDASSVDVELRVAGSVEDTAQVDGSRANDVLTLSHEFQTPGRYDVEIVARDGHGGESSVSELVEVRPRKPVFQSTRPPEASREVDSGDEVEFSVSASDPDGGEVSYEWFVDGSAVGTGTTYEHQFSSAGSTDIRVVATDEWGATAERNWQVDVESFRTSPTVDDQTSETRVVAGESTEFVTLSVENPDVNDRTAAIEIVASLPDGVEISAASNVNQGSGAQQKFTADVAPGDSRSMRLDIRAIDESLAGETLDVDYTIRYYPSGQPDDLIVAEEQTAQIEVVESTDETGAGSGGDGPNAESPSSGTDDEIPGFTPVLTLIALGVWLRRAID